MFDEPAPVVRGIRSTSHFYIALLLSTLKALPTFYTKHLPLSNYLPTSSIHLSSIDLSGIDLTSKFSLPTKPINQIDKIPYYSNQSASKLPDFFQSSLESKKSKKSCLVLSSKHLAKKKSYRSPNLLPVTCTLNRKKERKEKKTELCFVALLA